MRTFRLALVQMNSVVGDLEENTRKILVSMDAVRSLDIDLVAFPEMAITGYPAEDLIYKTSFLKGNQKAMERIVGASKGMAVVVGYVDARQGIYNSAAVGFNGQLVDVYHKMFLPTYGVFDEDRYFSRGKVCPVYIINGVGIGVNICEDVWHGLGPVGVQRDAGAEVIVNINASPYHVGKQNVRESMIHTRATDNGVYFAYLNAVGGQDELVFDGASNVFDPKGKLIARGREFEEDIVVVDLEIDEVAPSRIQEPRLHKEVGPIIGDSGKGRIIHISEHVIKQRPVLEKGTLSESIDGSEEVYKALVTGTRDYVRKSGFQKVIIGLSGGIDSALTTCVASDALGPKNVVVVSMPSRYSSDGSLVDAELLSKNLGVELWTIPIERVHEAMLNVLEESFQGTETGVAEENVQSRIRGNLLMAISNKFDWLVLTTGNKSETAMGYSTLYGDMAGGFSVLKDVPKTLVYDLAEWRNQADDINELIPQSIINKPPSAELRPHQKDEDTLPPYHILDGIIKAYVEEDRNYQDIVDLGYDKETVENVITTVDKSEYKRRQAPPGVKITPKAFGKDRRLPIVNRYRQF